MSTLDIVAEREKRVRTKRGVGHRVKPLALLFLGEHLGLHLENLLPLALSKHVHIILADIQINRVVAVCAADIVHKLQIHNHRRLTQIPVVRLCSCKTRAVNTRLLSRADTDCLSARRVSNRVGLRVFQRYQSDCKVVESALRDFLILGGTVREKRVVDDKLVSALLKGNSVNLLALDGSGRVVRVNLNDVVSALALGLEDFKSVRVIARSDNAVRYLALNNSRSRSVADVRKRDEITEAGHSVGTARSCIRAGKRRKLAQIVNPVNLRKRFGERSADCSTRGRNVLERSCRGHTCCRFKLLDKLPAVESVHKVDIAGLAVQHFNRQIRAAFHKNSGRLLVGVAAVFEFKFVHKSSSITCSCLQFCSRTCRFRYRYNV